MDNILGKRIKALRLKNEKTLEVVAKAVGISRQTLSRYETGAITNIPSDKIEKIAGFFKISPAYLMGWEEEEKKAEQTANITSVLLEDDEARELVDALLRVRTNDPENYKIVKALINSFDK